MIGVGRHDSAAYRRSASDEPFAGRHRTEPRRTTMRHGKSAAALVLLLGSLASGCSSGGSRLESIAHELNDAVNRCLGDVRDRRVKFEDSVNCRSMGKVAKQYVDAGGFADSAACRADRIAESARARAWMAMAFSKAGDANLNIW